MPIPPQIEKDIDVIKTPSNRILVRCLLAAILALAGVVTYLTKGGNKSQEMQMGIYRAQLVSCQALGDKKDTEIARLNTYIITEAQEDIKHDREVIAKQNEIIEKYKTLMK